MRIIQTFWSGNKQDILNSSYGWYSPMYHIMSWVLSSNLLSKLYNDLELYTDNKGYELLIKKLKLPYSKVHIVLDELNTYDNNLWALSKIHVYSLQKEPFIHIDGDVFIWKKINQKLENSEFITQNMESATEYYKKIWKELESNLSYFPQEIIQDRKMDTEINAYNAGIFGGKNIDFIKQYTEKAFDFVDKNISSLEKIKVTNFNIFFEQYLFYCMTKNKEIGCLFDEVIEDNGYKGFGNFEDAPKTKTYLHLLGTYKRNYKTCIKMSRQLLVEFPSEYLKVLELFSSKSYKIYNTVFKKINSQTFKSFQEYYKSATRIEKFPRTIEILQTHQKYTLDEIKLIFKSEKKIASEVKAFNEDRVTSVYSYEKNNEDYLNSLSHINVYNLCKSDYKSAKLYLDFIENPSLYLLKRVPSVIEIKTPYLVGDDMSFYIGEDITKSFTRIITPTLEKPYYQEVIMDELDEIIYKETIGSINYKQLLAKLEKYFDLADLQNSKTEYDRLILNKVRMLIYNNVFYVHKIQLHDC